MAALIETPAPGRKRAGVRHTRKLNPKTDMTPMVDLGFLLIAFFIVTAVINKPVLEQLNMPHDGLPIKLGMSDALTVLISKDHALYYYEGALDEAVTSNAILKTNFDINHGIGNVIRAKQKSLDQDPLSKEKRNGLMLLIKPTADASYDDLLKVLDEVLINDVKKYAIVKLEPADMKFLRAKGL